MPRESSSVKINFFQSHSGEGKWKKCLFIFSHSLKSVDVQNEDVTQKAINPEVDSIHSLLFFSFVFYCGRHLFH